MASGKSQEEILEDILKALTGGSGNSSPTSKAYTGGTDEASVKQTIADLKKQHDAFSKWNAVLKKGHLQYADVTEQLKEFDKQILKATNSAEQGVLVARKTELEQKARDANRKTAFYNSLSVLNKATGSVLGLGQSALSSAGNLTKSFLNGASGVQFSTEIMTAGLDLAGQASQAAGQAVTGVGAAMAQGTGTVKGFGIALEVAGTALGLVGEGASKFLKFGVEILSKEVEKTIASFNTMTAAGAMFSHGMDDMRNYSGMAGLTLAQFSNVVKNNSESLAQSGYTVTDAAKIVAGVSGNLATQTGKSGLKLRTELLNLGYSFEEQSNLVATMTSDLKKTGGNATNGQMAQATVEMGKNMKIVADIMGQDAKAKMDQAKKEAEQYAFNAKVREIAKKNNDPGLFKRVEAGLALMDDTQRRASIQATVLGTVTDVAANIYGQTGPAMAFAQNLESGGKSIEGMVIGFAKANDQLEAHTNSTMEAVSIGNIANGSMGDLAKSADSLSQSAFKLTSANLASATKQIEEAAAVKGGLQSTVVDIETRMQDTAIKMQTMLEAPMKNFGIVLDEVIVKMQSIINEATGNLNETKGSFWDRTKARWKEGQDDEITRTLGKVAGSYAGGTIGAAAGTVIAPGAGTWAGGIGGGLLGEQFGGDIATGAESVGNVLWGAVKDITGYADGGISSGPESGHVELLHGSELILPLTTHGTIKEGTTGYSDLTNLMNNMVHTQQATLSTNVTSVTSNTPAEQNLDVLADALASLISTARDQLDKQDEMLRAMQDTKDYTERLYHSMS